jgi:hypothetical protein
MKRFPAVLIFCVTVALSSALIFPHTAAFSLPAPQAGQSQGHLQGQPQGAPAPQPQSQPLVFRNQIVMDPQGLGLEVFRMLVPKDWIFDGGITWNFSKNPPEAFTIYTVSSPDRNAIIQQFPHMNMFWSQDQQAQYSFSQMGNTIMQPMGAVDFLQNAFISQARQGVSNLKVIETQPLPGAAKQALDINNLMLNIFGQISPFTFPYETRADAGRVKVEYTQNGRRVVEDFTAVITYFITNQPSLSGMYFQNINWGPVVCSFRAPVEEMPAKIRQLQISLLSRFNNPVWSVSYTRLCALVTREQLRQQQAIFARYQQIHKTLEETNDIIWQTYQNKSAAEDRMFDSYIQSLRGVETYVDPVNNRNVDLPTGYDNAWTNGTDYVFSDSPNFNPNLNSSQNWQQLVRKR